MRIYTIIFSQYEEPMTKKFKSLRAAKIYASQEMHSGNAMIWDGDIPLIIKHDVNSKWISC